MKSFLKWGGIALALLIVVSIATNGGSKSTSSKAAKAPVAAAQTPEATQAAASTPDAMEQATPEPTPTPKPKPQVTAGQRAALESARNYLDMGGFSKRKLTQQLSSSYGEGFSRSDARWAVKHSGADWNQEAVDSAKSYMDMGGFSRQRLLEQLTSSYGEGFTQAQAEYAVEKVYR